MLQKGKVNINLFSFFTRSKKDLSTSPTILDTNSRNNGGKNRDKKEKEVNLSTNNIKIPVPSLKDMEFSWSDNY